MIARVQADQEELKVATFKPGLNVILAERTRESTSKDSRNGLGKSTLIDIIHFCLGSSAGPRDPLRIEPLGHWTFELLMTLRNKDVVIKRSGDQFGKIFLEGDFSDWPIQPSVEKDSEQRYLLTNDWNLLLGWAMFDLPAEKSEVRYTPTFRSLFAYVSRRGNGGYLSFLTQHEKQSEWDKQVNTAFLLDLNWEHAQRWQLLKDRKAELNQLSKLEAELKTGAAARFLGSLGTLESTKTRLEQEIQQEGRALESFIVHEQYEQIQREANSLTFQIRDLNNANVIDQDLLTIYEENLQNEDVFDGNAVAKIFAEAGVELGSNVVKRLEEVQEFYQQVILNRRNFLTSEIGVLTNSIAERKALVAQLSDRKTEYMQVLKSHGALEEYMRLQHIHSEKVADLQSLDRRIELIQTIERQKSANRIETEQLRLDARSDLEDRRSEREKAIVNFNANSEALYETPGELVIDLKESGFQFDVKIERSGSQGIDRMKIFCYDLMLAQIWSDKLIHPGILIHDSLIFDGVDERQRARALELAAQQAKEHNFQYICCLNSDMVPYQEFTPSFDFDSYVRLRLTDASEDGGLLGFRY